MPVSPVARATCAHRSIRRASNPACGEADEEHLEPDIDQSESADDIGEAVSDGLLQAILTVRRFVPTQVRRTVATEDDSDSPTQELESLPAIDQVQLRELDPALLPAPRQRSSGGWPVGGGWRLRTSMELERDREIGARAEELIYLSELERVRTLGYPQSRVVWTSRENPAADHDILSVAEDGGELWLEVKGTRGRDGRFDWSRSEFDRARQERGRYVLCRVYEADTISPSVRRIVDPVGKLLDGQIRLDIATLTAEVPPLGEA